MYCSNCGQQIPNDATNCPYCGNPISGVQVSEHKLDIPVATTQATGGAIQQTVSTFKCPRCGNTDPKGKAFSTGLFIFLLCCIGCLPGLVYYLMRNDKVKCYQCGKVF
jgi:predicted RNA-binding Zn-ribbon protein involved in translation (DUF1610 family)